MKTSNKVSKHRSKLIILAVLLTMNSCKKLVEVGAPVSSINGANVYTNDATAISVLTGIYVTMSYPGTFSGNASISLFASLSADELTLYSGVTQISYVDYYKNSLKVTSSQSTGAEHWAPLYNKIYACNAAIEGLTSSISLTSSVKEQLLGEAKFVRAFCYFYLVSLYGDVPLVISTDYKTNSELSRTEKSKVWKQIITDLKGAQNLLSENYLDPTLLNTTNERVRPTKWAATALLARAYLYLEDWSNAENEATALINNTGTFSLPNDLNDVFLTNSTEAIWQLQPVRAGRNTEDAWTFIIPLSGLSDIDGFNGNPVHLNPLLLNSFETNDHRKINWIGSIIVSGVTYYYPYKYKSATLDEPVTEYLMVLRLAEQYLIRAESKSRLGNISGAIEDLNFIRRRAGLPNTTATTQSTILSAILQECKVELFTEWGHRWLDLKRTNSIDAVMNVVTPQKGGTWNSYQQLYPLPLSDIQRNKNLAQNPGY